MNVNIKLYRRYDREPSDHSYGEEFDNELNRIVGGKDKWSPTPEASSCDKPPAAKIADTDTKIELHEDGPLISFILENLDLVPACVSAIASLISAWVAVRAVRASKLPENSMDRESGTIIEIGEYKFTCDKNLTPKQVEEMLKSIARVSEMT